MINKENAKLEYRPGDRFSPIPPHEAALPTVTAEYFYHVFEGPDMLSLEGLCFASDRVLFFTDIQRGGVMKFDMEEQTLTRIFQFESKEDLLPASVKIRKDGRLFVCCIARSGRNAGTFRRNGGIWSMNQDGSDVQCVIQGMCADDMAFDEDGGFYFNYYRGTVNGADGGVFYVPADGSGMVPVVQNLQSPNGIALSKNGNGLWITETAAGRLLYYNLNRGISNVAYQFTGLNGPDSCEIDADGNVYVAMYMQGRILVFNPMGNPIGQILLPDRDKGKNLHSTHTMIRPGTRELYICSCDDKGGDGAWLFRTGSFAPAK